jgi:hypothetical protein
MHVVGIESWSKQRMTSADACISTTLGLIDQTPQLLRNRCMAQPGLVSSRLHGDRQEFPVVAI